MAKQGMGRPNQRPTHGIFSKPKMHKPKNAAEPVPEMRGKEKSKPREK